MKNAAGSIKHGEYDECYEDVGRTFSGFLVKIIRGVVPVTLPQITASKVAYVSLDMNCAAPELGAAEYLWLRMVHGAIMVLDDYGWLRHAATKKAFDQFAAQKGVPLLSLPTRQGIIVKI